MECGGLGEPLRFECDSYLWNHDLVGSFPPNGGFSEYRVGVPEAPNPSDHFYVKTKK